MTQRCKNEKPIVKAVAVVFVELVNEVLWLGAPSKNHVSLLHTTTCSGRDGFTIPGTTVSQVAKVLPISAVSLHGRHTFYDSGHYMV